MPSFNRARVSNDNSLALKSIIQSLYAELDKKEEKHQNEIKNYQDEVDNLNDLVRLLRRQKFAPKTEYISIPVEQLRLFNEAEFDIYEVPEEQKVETYSKKL